ncbi:hypothetical protein CDAR_559821 [Caerostris darwini]|uniref:Uncharacterized protein n=1 Tax=Caerostris darwini TaxID=1538125 RepID=A0AAV4TBD7_9ARAC|nr:hypothetical protein CDAR_559821 [Caerostris darwini]
MKMHVSESSVFPWRDIVRSVSNENPASLPRGTDDHRPDQCKLQFLLANDFMPETEPKALKLKCESLHSCRPLRTHSGLERVMRMHVSEISVFPRRDIVCSVSNEPPALLPGGGSVVVIP